MPRSSSQLRIDAEQIWWAGVEAVQPSRLIHKRVAVDGNWLHLGEEIIDLRHVGRIAIVGAGKAAGAMAAALETVLGQSLLDDKQVTGCVNVPAGCVVPTDRVHLHVGRPAGINEPRLEGVEGTQKILELVSSLDPSDLCLCVLTGGGSALLPAPVPGISLDDKIRLTRLMSAAGANIEQLNTLRRPLSRIKGGGLARACRAGRLVSLIVSDVLGDPLEVIASGPTVPNPREAGDPLEVLADLHLLENAALSSVVSYLRRVQSPDTIETQNHGNPNTQVTNLILGNNATAVHAAGREAERLGYSPAMTSANSSEGPAEEVGRQLAEVAIRMRSDTGPNCLISGGEPTVTLVNESRRGKGGRNQQLVLAALPALDDCAGVALLSGGTDGEDGPTDAAGAVVTQEIIGKANNRGLDSQEYLARNDAYHFFEAAGGLFLTGPTQTNVCDLRIITVQCR